MENCKSACVYCFEEKLTTKCAKLFVIAPLFFTLFLPLVIILFAIVTVGVFGRDDTIYFRDCLELGVMTSFVIGILFFFLKLALLPILAIICMFR